MRRDYYAVLGITATAVPREVRQAYRRLARQYSPDVNFWERDARALFEEISEAYRVLSDPASIASDASGGRLASPAWAEWYMGSWREMAPAGAWGPPPGMSMRVIDAQTGFLATDYCPIRQQEYFKPGTEPTDPCPVHGLDYQGEGDTLPQNWPDQRSWEKDIGRKISKALGKIFKF